MAILVSRDGNGVLPTSSASGVGSASRDRWGVGG